MQRVLRTPYPAEAMVNIRVSYGTIIHELKDVSKSYKEAGMALDVGRIFYPGHNILAYNELGTDGSSISFLFPFATCSERSIWGTGCIRV